MKNNLLLVLVTLLIISPGFAQKSAEPCCSIIAIGSSNNMVFARDQTSGRFFRFKADALDIKSLNKGDAISINGTTQQTATINGISRTYAMIEPDPVEPCCNISGMKPNPAEPCCNIIAGKNAATGVSFHFSVPKLISASLKIGQAISILHFGPADFGPADFGPADFGPADFAIVESSIGVLRGHSSAMYSYSVHKDSIKVDNGGQSNLAGKSWEMKANTIPGTTGRILITLPADIECVGYIYTHGKNERLKTFSKDRVFLLIPGVYDLRVSSEIVQDEINVQKGMDTRIHAGILNVVTPAAWNLFDESKKIRITGATGSKKIGLPTGTYQLKINGTFLPVIIKDGETVEL
jgi:hypothetical protein